MSSPLIGFTIGLTFFNLFHILIYFILLFITCNLILHFLNKIFKYLIYYKIQPIHNMEIIL